ncbi:MAG: HAD-IA family hydrolase [Clostridia bacterium]|nr:HAD-IA family hydrolase [Clostridia bacterium]
MIKAVLFDLDGTLLDTLGDLSRGVNAELSKRGYPTHPKDAFKNFAGNGIPKMVERAAPKDIDPDELKEITDSFISHYSVHYADYTEVYSGIAELIKAVKDKGIKVAVVTNKAQGPAELVVNKFFGDSFDLIFGQKPGIPAKPDPTAALLAMKELGVTPKECVFMGDSGVDVETGVNSGAYPVGVLWGFRDETELKGAGAKELIKNPLKLISIIDKLNSEEK